MRIDILTVMPDALESPLHTSILQRAQDKGLVEIHVHNLRDWSLRKHRKVDDYPFGGEAGMVMQIEPVWRCMEELKSQRHYDEIIFTSRTIASASTSSPGKSPSVTMCSLGENCPLPSLPMPWCACCPVPSVTSRAP